MEFSFVLYLKKLSVAEFVQKPVFRTLLFSSGLLNLFNFEAYLEFVKCLIGSNLVVLLIIFLLFIANRLI